MTTPLAIADVASAFVLVLACCWACVAICSRLVGSRRPPDSWRDASLDDRAEAASAVRQLVADVNRRLGYRADGTRIPRAK